MYDSEARLLLLTVNSHSFASVCRTVFFCVVTAAAASCDQASNVDGGARVPQAAAGSVPSSAKADSSAQPDGAVAAVATLTELVDRFRAKRIDAFLAACRTYRLAKLRELLALSGNDAVDVHAQDEEAFRSACIAGHLGVVRELLALTGDRQVDVHTMGGAAFQGACKAGHIDIVRKLLELTGDRTVDVNAGDNEAFWSACEGGHTDVMRKLLTLTGDQEVSLQDCERGGKLLSAACTAGEWHVVHTLLDCLAHRGLDVHFDDELAFRTACAKGKVDVVRELLALTGDRRVDAYAKKEEAFRLACKGGHVGVVSQLLALTGDRAVDAGTWGDGALWRALRWPYHGKVRELLALTGDRAVMMRSPRIGATVLDVCKADRWDMARELIRVGCDRGLDVNGVGHPPGEHEVFRTACSSGHLDILRCLLSLTGDRTVNVHVMNERPLYLACNWSKLPVVRELLALAGDRRVDVHAEGERALRVACHNECKEIVVELLALQGDRVPQTHHTYAIELLNCGPPVPPSPADEARWQAVSSEHGLAHSKQADSRMVTAARAGCRVWWRWRRTQMVAWRVRARASASAATGAAAAEQ